MSNDSSSSTSVIYKDIPDWPNYRAGSDGTIWSCKVRGGKGKIGTTWRQMKPHKKFRDTCCYYAIILCNNKKSQLIYVHKLILEAFIGPRPEGMECCHNDGNGLNNNLSNIRWDTKKGNCLDRIKHGTQVRGVQCHFSKLDDNKIREIRLLYSMGSYSYVQLAKQYGVVDDSISNIIKGLTWRHVGELPSLEDQVFLKNLLSRLESDEN